MTAPITVFTIQQRMLACSFFLVALIIGWSGMASLPPDEHEILVLRTAQEMHARGDWVVPYFNDEPRLKKPPLSYWLTGLTAFVSGANGQVVAWHGRVPSVLAGLAMAAMLLWAGRRFYGPRAALYATALFVSSVGFFTFTHDGRPDFLYAAFCTAGWLAGAFGLFAAPGQSARAILWMWLAFALASLSKGPHIPFMLLVAMTLYCLTRQPRGSLSPRLLRPLMGIVIVALLTVPWWLTLHARVDATAVRSSQLAGRLLVPHFDLLFNGYYLYRPLQLVLPWLPLAVVAWCFALRDRGTTRAFTVFLVFCIGGVALGLSFGTQQRFFYMLPVLPALCLLAGQGLAQLEAWRPRLAGSLSVAQSALIAAAAAWVFCSQHDIAGLVAVCVGALLIGGLVVRGFVSLCVGGLLVGMLMATATFTRFVDGDALWNIARFDRHALARSVVSQVDKSEALFSFGVTPVLYIQVSGRAIPELLSVAALERAMAKRHLHEAYVLAPVKRSQELRARLHVQALALMREKANDRAGLYYVSLDRTKPQ